MKGLAAVCGFDPLCLAAPDRGVEGIRHYAPLHGLMPRLGLFEGHESHLPFDFDPVLRARRPVPGVAKENPQAPVRSLSKL